MIKIDIDTRCWQIPKEECFLGVESDDKVKILRFELSKNEFCNGLNFTDCNCFINYKNEGNDTIPYGITDMEVQGDGTVTFTWQVSRGATIFKGNTFAVLCAKKVNDDGTITNEWNSRIGSFTVAKGIEPLSSITEVPEIDIISQLLSVAQQANANAQTNINQSNSLLEKAEGLREQVSKLKSDLVKCVHYEPYKNIFNKDSTDKVSGFYINMTNGYKNINDSWSAYILPVKAGETISINEYGAHCNFVSEYTNLSTLETNTKVKGWIRGFYSGNGIVVPDNAKYLIISFNSFNYMQVEYNDVSTDFTPYRLVVPNTLELQEQIDTLDISLENKIDYIQSKNIFNKNSTDKVDGFWINNTNGNAYKNINSALSTYCIPIIAGKTISIKGCSDSAHYAFCSRYTNIAKLPMNDILLGYISGGYCPNGKEGIVVPENAKYLYFDTNTEWLDYVQIEYNERSTSYEPYGNLIPTNNHIVKVGIGQDFETLKAGIEYATRFNGSIVKVKKGTYDLVEEFGDELSTSKGLVLKNNVHVIFEVGSKVLFNYEGDLQNVHVNFSPFNSGTYGFIIENLDLEASNCRYCIHDERGNSNDFYHNVYKNCRMKLDNANNPDWKNPQCIGTGVANGVIEIENCRFNNYITFHNNNGTSTNSKSNVYIKDCYFERGSIIVGSYGNSTEISNFYISGNSLGGNITNQDTESTALVNIELHTWNNEVRTV